MSQQDEQLSFLDEQSAADNTPVVCLGMTFESEESRRDYFREELRKKLPELKNIEGFPIGEDEDIIALSDPPYYTACPNPWINDFIEEWEKEKVTKYGRDLQEEYQKEPFAFDVSEGKRAPIYIAHTYHTKVPHKAIMRYLLHFTKPGDIVLDAFSGTGMTGVAGNLCSNTKEIESLGFKVDNNYILDESSNVVSEVGARKTVLNDLSPQGSFISYNYNTPINTLEFEREAQRVLNELEEELEWLFTTTVKNKQYKVNYFVWSDVFTCPHCLEELVFYEAASDKTGKVQKEFQCPSCKVSLKKNDLVRIFETVHDPVLNKVIQQAKQKMILVNYQDGKKKITKKAEEEDYKLLEKIEEYPIPTWFPSELLPNGYNTRQPLNSHGYSHTHHFYTKRILILLSRLFEKIKNSTSSDTLLMLFTSQIINLSKLNRYRPEVSFPYNPLNGTLYIGSLINESNMLDAYKNKVKRFVEAFIMSEKNTILSCFSSTALNLREDSIDYIFTDPPFGANIMYSELSYLWEAWHKVTTNNNSEAIINTVQNKTIVEYQRLIEKVFENYFKVLKPNRWITVEFSNSQAKVWTAIQEAIQKAGFVIANVSVLDKKQGSFKAVTSTIAVKQDLVISAYKPTKENILKMKNEINTVDSAWTFVNQHLEKLPVFSGTKGEASIIAERTPRILFDRMIAYHVQNGLPVPISSAEFQSGVAHRFPMRDGMAFLESQVAEYDKKRILVKEFSQMNLFVSDENSAIEWIRQQLMKKPQTRQDLHPQFMKEIQHIAKHEQLPELDSLLLQNFLRYEGDEVVPDQIGSYLRRNYHDLRGLENSDEKMKDKALNRWYVPDPNKQADLEKLREKSLLREFEGYIEELGTHKKKLRQFRTEAIRAGFKTAWSDKDYAKIVTVGDRLPESVIQEDDKLLMYYDNAQIRLDM